MNITIEHGLFFFFAAITLAAALMVITSRNAVRAVLSLVLAFVGSSALWILVQAEFLGIVLVLVYVGAVMVLFLFVVMMLDVSASRVKEGFIKHYPIAVVVAFVVIAELSYVLGPSKLGQTFSPVLPVKPANYSNILAIGHVMYTEYFLAFETAAILLLVAMVAAVGLTFRGAHGRKKQHPGKQAQVRKADRLRIVKSVTIDTPPMESR